MIDSNPAIGVKRYKSWGEGFHTWSEDEIAKFEARHEIGTRARLAFALLLYTAQRRSDVVRMGWQHVTGDLIAVRQEKTGTALVVPIHPELSLALASVPRTNLQFLMTEKGAPFTSAGFGNWFRDQCNLAEPAALFGAWVAQGCGDAIGERRMQQRPDKSDHRPSLTLRGRALHTRRRSKASRPGGVEDSDEGGRRTEIVQP